MNFSRFFIALVSGLFIFGLCTPALYLVYYYRFHRPDFLIVEVFLPLDWLIGASVFSSFFSTASSTYLIDRQEKRTFMLFFGGLIAATSFIILNTLTGYNLIGCLIVLSGLFVGWIPIYLWKKGQRIIITDTLDEHLTR